MTGGKSRGVEGGKSSISYSRRSGEEEERGVGRRIRGKWGGERERSREEEERGAERGAGRRKR